jgi:hypothetical protein
VQLQVPGLRTRVCRGGWGFQKKKTTSATSKPTKRRKKRGVGGWGQGEAVAVMMGMATKRQHFILSLFFFKTLITIIIQISNFNIFYLFFSISFLCVLVSKDPEGSCYEFEGKFYCQNRRAPAVECVAFRDHQQAEFKLVTQLREDQTAVGTSLLETARRRSSAGIIDEVS